MKKIKQTAKNCYGKAKKFFAVTCATLVMGSLTTLPAYAVTINQNADTASVVGGILDVVFKVAMYMGFIIAGAGVFTFIMAFKDDNAESQSRGARLAVVGAILIGLKAVVQLTGLIS